MLFSWLKRKKKRPLTPKGTVIYAIGDIHGRDDLLAELIALINKDLSATCNSKETCMVFLGDYVDRGLGSKAVIDTLLILEAETNGAWRNTIFLKGNHEEALLHFLEEPEFGRKWLEHGGTETLISYGVDAAVKRTGKAVWKKTAEDLKHALGKDHIAFLRHLRLCMEAGDYVFVHAGLRPGKTITQQTEQDMLWIRGDFLDATNQFEKKVVHGHTPKKQPYDDGRRIGVDTGAYITGVLTAVRLEDEKISFLQTGAKAPDSNAPE
ncbi:MAG: hypothetical protein COA84_01740 [Robiginitomaculum sp.]|nr:MAG: hypothetical protein COA84_01740 [Robiginitomaculum sp.]